VTSPLAFADNTCLDFPAAHSIPFASIGCVTAASSAGDHLVVASFQGAAAAINAINATSRCHLRTTLPAVRFSYSNLCVPAGITPETQVGVAVSVAGKGSAGNIYVSVQ